MVGKFQYRLHILSIYNNSIDICYLESTKKVLNVVCCLSRMYYLIDAKMVNFSLVLLFSAFCFIIRVRGETVTRYDHI